ALVSVALAGCDVHRGDSLPGRASDNWTRSYALSSEGEFQVVGAIGSVDVQGGPGSTIEVRAERVVRASSDAVAQPIVSRVQISEDVTPDRIVLRSEGLGGIMIGVD